MYRDMQSSALVSRSMPYSSMPSALRVFRIPLSADFGEKFAQCICVNCGKSGNDCTCSDGRVIDCSDCGLQDQHTNLALHVMQRAKYVDNDLCHVYADAGCTQPVALIIGSMSDMTLYQFNAASLPADDALLTCTSASHTKELLKPLLQHSHLSSHKSALETYNVAATIADTPMQIDVEHFGLVQSGSDSLASSQGDVVGSVIAQNNQLQVLLNVGNNGIACSLLTTHDSALCAHISHDWSPLSDVIQVVDGKVKGLIGLQSLLQQKTRMFVPTTTVNIETDPTQILHTSANHNNNLDIPIAVMQAMSLFRCKDEPFPLDKTNSWVNYSCGIASNRTRNQINAQTNAQINAPIEKQNDTQIQCLFSASVRYAIAHQNRNITAVMCNNHGMDLQGVTNTLLSGIAFCLRAESVVAPGGAPPVNAPPCRYVPVINRSDFAGGGDDLEKRRMHSCRHAMGTDKNTFKIQHDLCSSDIYAHICKDGGCVFSLNEPRNMVGVFLPPAEKTPEKKLPPEYNPEKPPVDIPLSNAREQKHFSASNRYGNTAVSNGMVPYRCIVGKIEADSVKPFNLRNAAINLAYINTACLQNPSTQLAKAHRYLRSCWLHTELLRLKETFPDSTCNVQYCTTASKLSNMAKLPLHSTNFWCTVPYC